MAVKKRGRRVTSRVHKHLRKVHRQITGAHRKVSKAIRKVAKHLAGRRPSLKSKASKVRKLIRLALGKRRR